MDNLGTSLFGGEPLLVLAALVTPASQVPVMAFFPGLLSGFLAYLYTWYRFPALFSLNNRMQPIQLEAFYSGLGLHVDMVPALQVFKTGLYGFGLSPSSLWTLSLWCMGE